MGYALTKSKASVFSFALSVVSAGAFACSNDVAVHVDPSPKHNPTITQPTPTSDRCSEWKRTNAYPIAPSVASVGAILPLHGLGAGASAAAYYEPCATKANLVVVRVHGGAWCGTCAWHASHTKEMLAFVEASRLTLVDVVLGDPSNHPATPDDASEFATKFGTKVYATTLADPDFTLRSLLPAGGAVSPLYVLVDRRTMTVERVLSNPDGPAFRSEVRDLLAQKDGSGRPTPEASPLVDGFFHEHEWDLIRAMTTPGAPSADVTNRYADKPEAAAFGRDLFRDKNLSPSGQIACATCHNPEKHFSDARPLAVGLDTGGRRTPQIALASHARWQFWDGRTDALWAQALGPLENELEHGSSRLFVAHYIASHYGATYTQVFPEYPLPNLDGLPPQGKPGDPVYDVLSAAQKESITRVYVNVGKAIAAYERTLRVKANRFDAYVAGDSNALTTLEKEGLSMFSQQGCMQCHWGPRLTDDAFHNVRLPGRASGPVDEGRYAGITRFGAAEFSTLSPWSDGPAQNLARASASPAELGAFKTPPLRGVANGSFFGHAGAMSDMREVHQMYGVGGVAAGDPRAVGAADPWMLQFGFTAQWGIPPFLAVMTADVENP